MRKYKGSLTASLEAQRDSLMGYGSEFQDVDIFARIAGKHPNWLWMSQILTKGLEWPLKPLIKECRCEDVNEALAFGNHKGASLQPSAQPPQVTCHIGCPFWLLPPPATQESKKHPGDPTCPNEYPETEYNQQAWMNCRKRLPDPCPELQMVLRHFSQQPNASQRASPLHVWSMHQANCQLGCHHLLQIPKHQDTCFKI